MNVFKIINEDEGGGRESRFSFLWDIFTFLAILIAAEHFLSKFQLSLFGSTKIFFKLSPYPYFCVIILIVLRYGIKKGLIAAIFVISVYFVNPFFLSDSIITPKIISFNTSSAKLLFLFTGIGIIAERGQRVLGEFKRKPSQLEKSFQKIERQFGEFQAIRRNLKENFLAQSAVYERKGRSPFLSKEGVIEAFAEGIINESEYFHMRLSKESVAELFKKKDVNIRRMVVQSLRQKKDRNSIGLLREVLRDESEEVRLYAAEALTEIDDMYFKEICTAKQLVRENPFLLEPRLRLGEIYSEYADKKIYDEIISEFYYHLALVEYEEILSLKPNFIFAYYYIGRIYQSQGLISNAIEKFQIALGIGPGLHKRPALGYLG